MPADLHNDRLRVAFSLDSFDPGGTELNAVRTAERLDRARYDIRFVCHRNEGALAERVRRAGLPIVTFPIERLVGPGALIHGLRFASWLRRERIDVFHAHDIYSNIFAVPFARMAGVPLVIASRRWWTETVRREHVWLNRTAYRFAHRVLANSESVATLVASEERVPRDKVIVIPNFVEEAAFEPPPPEFAAGVRSELGIATTDVIIGIIANFHSIKDHATLLRAFALLVPTHAGLRLVLVGDGNERDGLVDLARSLGITDRVVFAGQRPQHPTWHWTFDLSVLSSRGEGFPNSIVEAMAAARPIVATRVGGVPDAVEHGVSGLLVSPADPAAFAQALRTILDDPPLARRLGDAAARRARERYHADRVLAMLEEVYAAARHRH